MYFVTFRLADSVPTVELERLKQQCSLVTRSDITEEQRLELSRKLERYLDLGAGECILARRAVGQVVVDTLSHFDGERYLLDAYVVMPNHVHALVWPMEGHRLTGILPWKRYTARRINGLLGRTGPMWQPESFDHIIRDTAALNRCRSYIQENPKRLPQGRHILGEGKFRGTLGF